MKHFKNIQSLDDLKKQFRELAKENHPDVGGDGEAMKAINNEYDRLFPIWKHWHNNVALTPTTETADSTRNQFYTVNGWQGAKYDRSLSIKDIAKNIREYVKEIYPTCKFSITTRSGRAMTVALMEALQSIFSPELEEGHRQLNPYYLDNDKSLNEYGIAIMSDVNDQIKSYNYDDSDAMIDYFDTNFYYNIQIGKWDRDFKVVEKTARIKGKTNTRTAQDSLEPEDSWERVADTVELERNEGFWGEDLKEKILYLGADVDKNSYDAVDDFYADLGYGYEFTEEQLNSIGIYGTSDLQGFLSKGTTEPIIEVDNEWVEVQTSDDFLAGETGKTLEINLNPQVFELD